MGGYCPELAPGPGTAEQHYRVERYRRRPFAAALEMLLENPALCREMGEAALRIVRSEYSEEIIGARFYNLLQESLGLAVSPPVYSDGYAPEASARL